MGSIRRVSIVASLGLAVVALFLLATSIGCKSRAGRGSKLDGAKCGGAMQFRCPGNMYCRLGHNCGGIDAEGECVERPTICSNDIKEICGCDGVTYASECIAAAKGVTARGAGRCEVSEEAEDEADDTESEQEVETAE